MQRACEFRKGIVFKEWEHQKLRMRVEDLRAQLDVLEHVHVCIRAHVIGACEAVSLKRLLNLKNVP